MTNNSVISYAIALLSHYGFELRGYTAQELVNLWLERYQANWVRLGVIEALYQGRYKAISVEQILAVWARRGQPRYRFTHEFERLISRKFPKSWTTPKESHWTELSQERSLSQETLLQSEGAGSREQGVFFTSIADAAAPVGHFSLATSVQKISTEEELSEVNSQEQALSAQLETPLQVKNIASNLTETLIQSNNQLLEVATDKDVIASFQSQKSAARAKQLGDNSAMKPSVDNANFDAPCVATATAMPSENLKTGSNLIYNADWSRCQFSQLPIEQFTPPPDYSGFCLKLKAVAKHEDSKIDNGQ